MFYLINLGLHLGLYADFTSPLRPGIALPLWDFLALVGSELIGETIRADALWSLLARLSGREAQEEPGKGFEPPDQWSLPVDCRGLIEGYPEVFNPRLGKGQPLERWLKWLMPLLRARLSRALGEREPRALSRLLCEHRARVSFTPTHLEVMFALTDLPIEIRLSGLDRDPGWVPAGGRFVAFHYC